MQLKRYACPQCEPKERQVFSFRGLCRECTTYGDDGSVVEAVNRVRCDEFGNPVEVVNAHRPAEIRPGFRQPKKPTKRQLARSQPEIAKDIEGPIPEMTEILAGGEEE
jgi:hypothetical protein